MYYYLLYAYKHTTYSQFLNKANCYYLLVILDDPSLFHFSISQTTSNYLHKNQEKGTIFFFFVNHWFLKQSGRWCAQLVVYYVMSQLLIFQLTAANWDWYCLTCEAYFINLFFPCWHKKVNCPVTRLISQRCAVFVCKYVIEKYSS